MSNVNDRYIRLKSTNHYSDDKTQKKANAQGAINYSEYAEKRLNEKITHATLLRASKLKW